MNAEPDLHAWAAGERRNVLDLADVLGVVQADWITLQADLMSYAADYVIRKHGARWTVVDDPMAPRGYRCVVEVIGRDGQTRQLDPLRAVAREIADLPIEITRMLADAELALGLASEVLPATSSPTGAPATR
ncbi:hypothetical protein ACFV1A_12415 [Streptomyces seoulensis]|uniref:hypothetical protein n=1 Tax=Streptomyces seoulensis TaxID=73044 RepID=UPI0036C757B4